MAPDSNKPDLRPAIAGDVESFSDKDSLELLVRAEHPSAPLEESGAFEATPSLIADGTALQLSLSPELWEGGIEIFRPFPGIAVATWTCTPKDPEALRQLARKFVPTHDHISVHLFHTGDVSYRFGQQVFHSGESVGLVYYKPDPGEFEQQWQEGQQVCFTTINIMEEGERELWHRLGIMPPSLFQKLRTANSTEERVYELPNSLLFTQLACALVNLPSSGVAHTTMLRLKIGELFCLLGEETTLINDLSASGGLPFTEIKKLSQARAILEETTGTMPSIAELSAMVGLNRRKLTEGFKKVFGETVAVHALEVRLRKGYQLLKETQLPVQEIAEYCGYGHPRNFSIAFQRRFGCSPSQVRRQK
ncbi:helix-turn-helix transcriptional regulator [Pseudomaricurvus alkylphenolicus]|uniref:helix-turn-helix transcriptional regulator n=1 Tax=Pseudomaricurvus alkylphenolicus TaxID=1306991 RepID=UPI00141F6A2F|nr:AraC family transcriptional regulator [Pseudomaricurvus alkylphenolicus]NIB44650.1 helix-turn-helix transcriptional regulator [Pseudomaricurvus alkylphenolicus]